MSSILKNLTSKAAKTLSGKAKAKMTAFINRDQCAADRCRRRLRRISRLGGFSLTCGRPACEQWVFDADLKELAEATGIPAADLQDAA